MKTFPTGHMPGPASRRCAAAMGALALAVALAMPATAQAGRRCDAQPPTLESVRHSLRLAERTAQTLDAQHRQHGTRVVLLARAGQDLNRYGQQWSHVGWAWRTPQGAWQVVHKLNECGTDQSLLMRHGLAEFFLDDLWRWRAAWAPVPPALQDSLWRLLQDNLALRVMDEPRYSMVSHAWGTRYQQSNQWALETLALAAQPHLAASGSASPRVQAQRWLRDSGYRADVLRIDALTRLGGRMTAGNIAFDDHPDAQRFAGRIETITADSMLRWLPSLGAAAAQVVEP